MDRIERHDLINAVGLAAVLMTLALLLILGARVLFTTVNDGLIVSTADPSEETAEPSGSEGGGEGEGAPPVEDQPASQPQGDGLVEGEGEGEGEAMEPSTTTTTVAPTTTTTRPPAEVTVRIGNAAQRVGVAAAGSERLEELGYDVVDLANSPPLATSVVYFAPGFEAEAKAVAAALDVGADAVRPVPADPVIDASGAAVTIVLGRDNRVA